MEKEGRKHWNNRGQITIFIIMALIIVVIIIIILLLMLKTTNVMVVMDENNPQGSIETCTRQAIEEAINRISENGADINPGLSVQYKNDQIVYLCYTGEFYKACSFRRPLLIEHIQKEIKDFITPKVEDCFQKLKMRLSESSTSVRDTPGVNIEINLFPKHVGIKIDKDFQITRGDSTVSFKNFKMFMVHPIYDFADIAAEAASQQAKYCYFDSLGYMILHPSINIEETITGKSDKIYILTERATNHQYKFAVRSCPLPPGY